MKKGASSVFIAMFMLVLVYGALFSLLFVMDQPRLQQNPPRLHLLVAYNVSTQYLNLTNEGPETVTVEGFAFFNGREGYVIHYRASLNPGQSAFVYFYSSLEANETVAVLTDDGALEIKIV